MELGEKNKVQNNLNEEIEKLSKEYENHKAEIEKLS